MPESLLDKDVFKNLKGAVDYSRRQLRSYREKRMELLSQYVGKHYSDNASTVRVPMNLIEMAVNIYMRYLAAKSPRVMISTGNMRLKPSAHELSLVQNKTLQEIDYEQQQRLAVMDALFSMGIMKVGLTTGGYANIDNEELDVEQVFADSVSSDDWVHEAGPKVLGHCGFMGNRYRECYEEVMQNDLYDKRALDQIEPTERGDDDDGEEREEFLSQGGASHSESDDFEPYVELWDMYLPRRKLLVTYAAHGTVDRPLRVVPWTGPKGGPYHVLGFNDVPGQIMPLSPVSLMLDVHDLANRLLRKLGHQAERHKTLIGYRGTAYDDALRVKQSSDGEMIRMDAPEGTKEFTFGGVDQRNLAFTFMLKDLFSYTNGNLDMLGGLGGTSPTFGQDELISQNASKRVQDMQARVHTWATSIQRSIGSYLWTNPYLNTQVTMQHKSLRPYVKNFTADKKQGRFLDYDISIQPYSFVAQTPSQQLEKLFMFWERVVQPNMQMLMQEGERPNIRAFCRLVGENAQLEDVEELLLTYGAPPGQDAQTGARMGADARMPSVTHRTNERINRGSSTTPEGKQAAMLQALLSKDMSPRGMVGSR